MISNYLNCLKPTLCSQTKRKLSFLPLPFSRFNLSPFLHTKTENLNPNNNPKEQTPLSFFKNCSTMKQIEQMHTQIVKTGFEQDLYVVGKIIVFCAVSEWGSMNYATSVFEKIDNPDGFLWNTMIRGFGRISHIDNVFEYYKRMQEKGEVSDNFTFSFLLKVSGKLRVSWLGKQLHCSILKYGLESHAFVRNTLIHMYGMLREIGLASQLFDEIPKSDLVAWNTIIDCHVFCGKYQEALDLFLKMWEMGIVADEATFVVTLSACSALGALDFGRWIKSCVDNTSLVNVVSISNSLIDMYAKCGAVEEAYMTFSEMRERNLVTWNTIILGFAIHGNAKVALELFSRMLHEKLESPNDVTFLGVLCACSHGGMVDEGRRYFDMMIGDYHIQPTEKHHGCMVDILGRAGLVEEAYQLIRSIPVKCNAIVWRTLLAACRVHVNVELGEQVRRHLLELEPDHSSDYALLANMYASTGQWNDVMRVRKSVKNRRVHKPKPGSSIIDLVDRIGPQAQVRAN